MKQILILILALATLLITAACEATPMPRDELGQMVDAQTQATIAAAKLNSAKVEATTRADATRQYLILQGQQTRIAQDAQATATAQSAQTTATVIAAQFTATTHAQNVAATATTYAQNVAATATTQFAIAQATQVSASATATANAANAIQTRTSADATATVITAQVLTAQEKADWERRLESGRALASLIGWTLALIAGAVIIGLGVIRFIDAGVLRARVLRDKTGTVLVIGERDRDGRQMVLIPGRSPGAALTITPPNTSPLQIEADAVDEDTTKRDQAISLMIAATRNRNNPDDLMDELTAGDQVRLVDEPPAQLVSGEVRQLLDGDWKRLGDGTERDP